VTDYERFQRSFNKYRKLFGLSGYKVYFKKEAISDSFADIMVDVTGKCATVRFNDALSAKDKAFRNPSGEGKHEAIHLLVGKLSEVAQSRYISQREVVESEEELVRKLEELIK